MLSTRTSFSETDFDGSISFEGIQEHDSQRFLALQDEFAKCHHELSKQVYPHVDVRDWKLCLCCPLRILDTPNARIEQFYKMASAREPYEDLSILKATAKNRDGKGDEIVGYIMFELHHKPETKNLTSPVSSTGSRRHSPSGSPGSSPSTLAPPKSSGTAPWTQVLQLFVDSSNRRRGVGRRLIETMQRSSEAQGVFDMRLQVVDLNIAAMEWYRSLGFVITEFSRIFLGGRDDANIVVYQEMWRSGVPPERQHSLHSPTSSIRDFTAGATPSGSSLPGDGPEAIEEIPGESVHDDATGTMMSASSPPSVWGIASEVTTKGDDASEKAPLGTLGLAANKTKDLAPLFRSEIIGEIVTITYPDNAGVFDVRVSKYDENTKWHIVESDGLSYWDDDDFDDEIDLNEYYRNGRVRFKRHLCIIHREMTLRRREARKAQMEIRGRSARAKEQEGQRLLQVTMSAVGPLTRQRRRLAATANNDGIDVKDGIFAPPNSIPTRGIGTRSQKIQPKSAAPSQATPNTSAPRQCQASTGSVCRAPKRTRSQADLAADHDIKRITASQDMLAHSLSQISSAGAANGSKWVPGHCPPSSAKHASPKGGKANISGTLGPHVSQQKTTEDKTQLAVHRGISNPIASETAADTSCVVKDGFCKAELQADRFPEQNGTQPVACSIQVGCPGAVNLNETLFGGCGS